MGLRYKKELLSMKKDQVVLENGLVHIAESKTANGIGDMPLTQAAKEAFRRQMDETLGSEYLFPSPKPGAQTPYMTNLRKVWAKTLKKAGVPYFAPYELRHTFATRLSAGGAADHMVTQMLRQGDAEVFKLYSHAKLGMMRETLTKLDRQANGREVASTPRLS
jgi:integrase